MSDPLVTRARPQEAPGVRAKRLAAEREARDVAPPPVISPPAPLRFLSF